MPCKCREGALGLAPWEAPGELPGWPRVAGAVAPGHVPRKHGLCALWLQAPCPVGAPGLATCGRLCSPRLRALWGLPGWPAVAGPAAPGWVPRSSRLRTP